MSTDGDNPDKIENSANSGLGTSTKTPTTSKNTRKIRPDSNDRTTNPQANEALNSAALREMFTIPSTRTPENEIDETDAAFDELTVGQWQMLTQKIAETPLLRDQMRTTLGRYEQSDFRNNPFDQNATFYTGHRRPSSIRSTGSNYDDTNFAPTFPQTPVNPMYRRRAQQFPQLSTTQIPTPNPNNPTNLSANANVSTNTFQSPNVQMPKEVLRSIEMPRYSADRRETFLAFRTSFEEYCQIIELPYQFRAKVIRAALRGYARTWLAIQDPAQEWPYDKICRRLSAEFDEEDSAIQMSVLRSMTQKPTESVRAYFRKLQEETAKLYANTAYHVPDFVREQMIMSTAATGVRPELRAMAPGAMRAKTVEAMREEYHAAELNDKLLKDKIPRKLVGSRESSPDDRRRSTNKTSQKVRFWDNANNVNSVECETEFADDQSTQPYAAEINALTLEQAQTMMRQDRADLSLAMEQMVDQKFSKIEQILKNSNISTESTKMENPPRMIMNRKYPKEKLECWYCLKDHFWRHCRARLDRHGPDPVDAISQTQLPPYDLPYAPEIVRQKIRNSINNTYKNAERVHQLQTQVRIPETWRVSETNQYDYQPNYNLPTTQNVDPFSSYAGHPIDKLTPHTMSMLRAVNVSR